ncbi:MAG: hypothetical protein OXD47_05415 [Gammaproteobacteria bacterium]|nr:hypothetical protein [Gammaproteobacteria bacterium]MCY4211454.1 hypothetical protein [Gammaproteobacteria bacterium]MCY4281956.1 hypothetical protein [Gammaproteobacteria bacterium]MCY4338224.1 hypothetical protein [Gammaproteobacteria bacterium]
MNYELITIIITIIGTGIGVVGFISPRLSRIDDDINGLKERMTRLEIDLNKRMADLKERMTRLETDLNKRMADLKERMARLEGLFEGFTGRDQ